MRHRLSLSAILLIAFSVPVFSAYLDARAVHGELPAANPRPVAELTSTLGALQGAGYRLSGRELVCGGAAEIFTLRKEGVWGTREIRVQVLRDVAQAFASAAYRSRFLDALSFDHS